MPGKDQSNDFCQVEREECDEGGEPNFEDVFNNLNGSNIFIRLLFRIIEHFIS
jgi:hypothetical protein